LTELVTEAEHRSLARAFSSSRRAPPNAASNLFSPIWRSSVNGLYRIARRDGLDNTTGVDVFLHRRTTRRTPASATSSSRADHFVEVVPVSTCITGNGSRPGETP